MPPGPMPEDLEKPYYLVITCKFDMKGFYCIETKETVLAITSDIEIRKRSDYDEVVEIVQKILSKKLKQKIISLIITNIICLKNE